MTRRTEIRRNPDDDVLLITLVAAAGMGLWIYSRRQTAQGTSPAAGNSSHPITSRQCDGGWTPLESLTDAGGFPLETMQSPDGTWRLRQRCDLGGTNEYGAGAVLILHCSGSCGDGQSDAIPYETWDGSSYPGFKG